MKIKTTLLNIKNPSTGEWETIPALQGDTGPQGPKGDKGDKGADGLTTSIKVNGETYTQENGLITLPDILTDKDIPTKTSQLTNDSGFITSIPSEYVTETELTAKGYATQSYVDDNEIVATFYGTSTSLATDTEKIITVDDPKFALRVGTIIGYKPSVSNTASNVKFNVNGTGAYPIWYNTSEYTSSSTTPTGTINIYTFYMFDGTHWVYIARGNYSSYTPASLGFGYGVCSTEETTVAKACSISSYTLVVGGIVAIKFTYGVPANATLNIRTRGAKNIFYKGSAITDGVIKAGDTVTMQYDGTRYQVLNIDREVPTSTSQLTDDVGFAKQSEVDWLSEEIADQQTQIDGKQPKGNYANATHSHSEFASVDHTHDEYLTDSDFDALEDKLDSDAYKQSVAEKVPYVKVAEHPICVNSVAEMEDETKMYVLNSDGMFYAYKTKEITTEGSTKPNFTNMLNDTNTVIKTGSRWSTSGNAFKDATGMNAVIIKLPSNASITAGATIRVTYSNFDTNDEYPTYLGTSATSFVATQLSWSVESTGICKATAQNANSVYQWICIHLADSKLSGSIDDVVITVNEEITYTVVEGETQVITEWSSTGISYNQPADYEQRVIDAENDIEDLENKTSELENRINEVGGNSSSNGVLTMFIAPNGNDTNDGLTSSKPKKTVKACVDAGATRISAKRGTYNEKINLSNIDTLEIFPTDNDYTFDASVKRYPPIVFDTSHSISISSLSAYNSIKSVSYAETNEAMDYVFTNSLYDRVYSTTHGYHSVLWVITGNIKNDFKLKPVGTIAEVESTVNSFTRVDNVIYLNADLTNATEIRVPTIYSNALTVFTANKVKLTDVEIRFAGRYSILIENCPNVEMDNCSVKYTSNGSGFDMKNANGILRNCYASKVHDGYGIGDYGHTIFVDCVAEWCFDDGMSHHRGCTGTVIGGRYEGNGKGGNCPAHGANVNIYGGLYKDNALWGIAYWYENTYNPCTGMVQGATMVGNPKGLVVDAGSSVIALNCHYVGNTTDKEITGTLTEY